ncbi:hypothetical protein Vadar_018091 [Vaccinium darrowii]|uniref:Uncharacterized protein n=1 Tax=Vaccinium darrowii TaxID=229202 RepID=A0ACB7YWY8_9ERIC|nr:hypothetical protein Vadar_018091 [Vaccinium darrowii]
MVNHHFIIMTLAAQGHLNPCLQLAKRLIQLGVQVTFVVSVYGERRISRNFQTHDGLKFATYSDGYDEGIKPGDDFNRFFSESRTNSSKRLREIITTSREEGCPVTCLAYNLLFPWAAKVARDCHVPSSVLWIQPATVLDIYYYFFSGYEEVITQNYKDPAWSIELPGLPLFHGRDLPSMLFPSTNGHHNALPLFKELIEALNDSNTRPQILVNTFDALEPEALKVIEKYNLIAVGPLIPSAFLDERDSFDNSFECHLFEKTKDYTEWLNAKPESSVVYVSFGSLVKLPKPQMEEIARGLLETHRPFLWVIRAKPNGEEEKEEDRLSCIEELEQQGKISLASGVPVVAFPHLSDQATNAKMIADVWMTGVRVRPNEEGIVQSDEVKRCIEMVMKAEEKGEELRENAKKWKDLAREAVKEGGSSYGNLKAFLEEVGGDCK